MNAGRTTTIRKLRTRCTGDPIAGRLAIERELCVADVHPSWLPDHAVLCIRHLRISGVGSLAGNLKEAVERLAREAYHPVSGAVPESAESVVFEDRADLIAVYARDWIEHAVHRRWWWPQIFSGSAIQQGPAHVWNLHPEYIPAAVATLAQQGLAARLAVLLTPDEHAVLTRAAFRAHGLTAPVFDTPATTESRHRNDSPMAPGRRDRTRAASIVFHAMPEMADAALPAAARLFLALTLTLYRRSALARSPEFRQAAEVWFLNQHEFEPSDDPAAVMDSSGAITAAAMPEALSAVEPATMETASTVPVPDVPADIDALRTAYAGIFCLANAGVFLSLYSDFTRPEERDDVPPFWDFIECLARDLLVVEPETHFDQIWSLLAELAGRHRAERPEIESIPARWCETSELELPASVTWPVLVHAINKRIADALDSPPEAAAALLMRRRGSVQVSATHISVTMHLDELPLPVRTSGLDRNPGWIPAAGRFIHFVYE